MISLLPLPSPQNSQIVPLYKSKEVTNFSTFHAFPTQKVKSKTAGCPTRLSDLASEHTFYLIFNITIYLTLYILDTLAYLLNLEHANQDLTSGPLHTLLCLKHSSSRYSNVLLPCLIQVSDQGDLISNTLSYHCI